MSNGSIFITKPHVPANGDGLPHADTFLIGGQPCPGKATLIAANSPRPWDIRKGNGMSGATVVQLGDDLSHPIFAVEIWDPVQWLLFQAFAAKYLAKGARFKPGTVTPVALGIYHPILSSPPWLITEVVVEDVTTPKQDDTGMWTLEIHFLEFKRPKIDKVGKVDAAFSPTQQPVSSALDKLQAEVVASTTRLQNLANGGQ